MGLLISSLTWALLLSLEPALTHAQSDDSNNSSYNIQAGCQENNATFSKTQVNFSLSSDPPTLYVHFQGESSVSGNSTLHLWLYSQSQVVLNQVYDPCQEPAIPQFCPLAAGPFNVSINLGNLPWESVPDIGALDLAVTHNGEADLTCVQASIAGGEDSSSSEGNQANGSSLEGSGGSSDVNNNDTSANSEGESSDDSSSANPALKSWGMLLFSVFTIFLSQAVYL